MSNEREHANVKLRDRIRNAVIRQRSKVTYTIENFTNNNNKRNGNELNTSPE